MTDRPSSFSYALALAAIGLVSAPLLGELVARPAFDLGWNAAALCAAVVSNGFAF